MDNPVIVTIDEKEVPMHRGANLLQGAIDAGFDIPHLCYHRKLSPTGACRLCLVKIEGMRGFTASCTVEVEEPITVTAFDGELEELRRHTLDYLLSELNEVDDEVAALARRYGLDCRAKQKAADLSGSITRRIDRSSSVLTYDSGKCISCFRCIKGCAEVQGKNVLSMADRGIEGYVAAGFGEWALSECDGCGECVQLCPSGALMVKGESALTGTPEIGSNPKKVRTTCPYCGVGCQLLLTVKDGRIIKSDGLEGIKPNDGRLCVKGRFGLDFVHSGDRLSVPLIKRNGRFEEAGWDEALDLAASKFSEIKEHAGSDALAGYASAKCTNEESYLFQKCIRTAFGTNNLDYCTRLCHSSTVTAMIRSIGDGAGTNSIEDFRDTDCLFVTGNNMIETHPVTATFVKEGLRKGLRLIVCDPRWTPLADLADVWLQPKIGTDVALLNGMINLIIEEGRFDRDFIETRVEGGMEAFEKLKELVSGYPLDRVEEITGVPETLAARAARIYADAPTAMIATGMGMSQQTCGTDNVFALLNMMLITGQVGRERCGIDPPRGQNNVQGVTDVGCSPVVYPGYIPVGNEENRRRLEKLWKLPAGTLPGTPGLTTVEIMNGAFDGSVKGLYIMGENPYITDPDQNHTAHALENLEFLVVQDIFMTETARFADVVLPAASFAEKNGTFVNSDRRVLRVRKAVESPGSAREDWRICSEIGKRMGTDIGTFEDESAIFDEAAEATPIIAGISWERIEDEGIQWPCPEAGHPGTSTLFLERFNTESRKAGLNPVHFIPPSEHVTERFPFILNTGRLLFQYHTSTMSRRSDSLNSFANESYALIHPLDAKMVGIAEGQKVVVSNDRGSFTTSVRLSGGVHRGEIFVPFHFAESAVNQLTRAGELDPHSKMAPFKQSACRIDPAQ
jgi:formate dehydrogenase alpha subunit